MEYKKSEKYPYNAQGNHLKKEGSEMFFTRNRSYLKLSAATRDYLLPYKYVRFEIENDFLRIIPSADTSDYKISVFNGQASLCYQRMQRFIDIPKGTRIPLTPADDNSLIAQL